MGFIVCNIDIIKFFLYIIQILIIGIGIYVGYINYKELIRKNNLEESPFLRITNGIKEDIIIKSYGKTPINIITMEFYGYKNNQFELIPKSDYPLNMCNDEIFPNETIAFSRSFLDKYVDNYGYTYQFKIKYNNHIKNMEKVISITR